MVKSFWIKISCNREILFSSQRLTKRQNLFLMVEVRINDGDSGRDNINLTLSKKAAKKLRIKKGINTEVDIKVIR